MYSFKNDYSEGVHPVILNKLLETNLSQQTGYGDDDYSSRAKAAIKQAIGLNDAKVYFSAGGTQANLMVIASVLQSHEAVISAKTGHIYAHETGAIESVGHRIITINTDNGKLTPAMIAPILAEYTLRPHVVLPKLVYISNSTELGTVYSKAELESLWLFCQQNGLYLFMDGARIGHALTAIGNDLTLQDVARLTDVFYIGGTKNGAFLGEAIVFSTTGLGDHFDYLMKQKGALLAKGRLIGLQFMELFNNDLYFSLARHANEMAQKIAYTLNNKGISFLIDSPTNQIFPILSKKQIDVLNKKYYFYLWKENDTNSAAIRLITSWATEEHMVDAFLDDFDRSL